MNAAKGRLASLTAGLERHQKAVAVAFAIIVLVTRLAAIQFVAPGGLLSSDPGLNDGYHGAAQRFAETGRLEGFYKAPLYLLSVLAAYAPFGPEPWVARLLNVVFSIGLALLLWFPVRRRTDETLAAFAAAGAVALSPLAVFHDTFVLSDSLHALAVTGAVVALLLARTQERRWWFAGGVLVIAAAYAKGSMYVFAGVGALMALSSFAGGEMPWPPRFRRLAWFLGGVALLMVPWNLYKKWDGGEWNLTDRLDGNVWSGVILHGGFADSVRESREIAQNRSEVDLPYQQRMHRAGDRLKEAVSEDPWVLVRPVPRKIARFWGLAPDNFQSAPRPARYVIQGIFLGLYLLGLAGLWVALRRGSPDTRWLAMLVAGALVTIMGVHTLVTSHFRYSLPLQPWVIFFAVVALTRGTGFPRPGHSTIAREAR
jgi:4-amino-4-deoxy-L-arabinose transferase-like glycosyltransferase